MTDKKRFDVAFNRLAVATRLPADEGDPVMKQTYWEGLSELPIEAVEVAAANLAKTLGWFPKLAEWREAAKVHRSVLLDRALTPAREEPWKHECEDCEDTGWRTFHCVPGTDVNCGRPKCIKGEYLHLQADGTVRVIEHDYVVRCPCRPTNATYRRRHNYAQVVAQ